ncbi:YbjN domain-containing protein [Donghicola eburneus]|uniref:Putative diacylglyceryl transferase n=1 Tax=Donghicola eburneus TaxID=393278 RepID=A0A1M4N188_9RHOB|nr:YbjN domain-containing protein [Donghicola eburneus]SCM66836.1 putative diacylglyceryl transferase [Donghicola eburneus]SFQ60735.1 hypothetical protein SAMN05421764_107113 [Donghicola eburneus]
MAVTEEFLSDDLHPIDLVETLAENRAWDFDRVGDNQIAMAVVGQWRTYSITLAWSDYDETLRLVCTFEMDPPHHRMPQVYETLNLINDQVWSGAFSYWEKHRLMVYRYGLLLAGGQLATPAQVDLMISSAVANAERFYPAMQLVAWGGREPADGLQVAIAEAYGRA